MGRQAAMVIRVHHICALAILCVPLPQAAQAQGYPSYPYSIMTPERGSGIHQRAVRHRGASAAETTPATPATTAATEPHHPSLLGREKFIAKLHRRGLYGAWLVGLGAANPVAAHPAHSAGRWWRTDASAATAGARTNPDSGYRENHSQFAAWSGDVPGPCLALRVPIGALRRAGKSAQPVYGLVLAVIADILACRGRSAACNGVPPTRDLYTPGV